MLASARGPMTSIGPYSVVVNTILQKNRTPFTGHGKNQIIRLFDGRSTPDVARIIHDGTIGAEDTGVGDVL